MVGKLIRATLAAALLVAAMALLSSCGSGDDGSATASEPLTKAQFIKQASAICASEETRKKEAIESAREGGIAGANKKELAQLVADAILPLYEEMIGEMAALNPPVKDEATVNHIIDQYEKTLKEAEAKPSVLVVNDIFLKPNLVAEKYGVKNCTL